MVSGGVFFYFFSQQLSASHQEPLQNIPLWFAFFEPLQGVLQSLEGMDGLRCIGISRGRYARDNVCCQAHQAQGGRGQLLYALSAQHPTAEVGVLKQTHQHLGQRYAAAETVLHKSRVAFNRAHQVV